ncbi:hypothetical protein HY504_00965 [Candidatus Wolfebacteria bacterium]|nr:hypothetical protein [Candidatus Wolfebacteria bacterium]
MKMRKAGFPASLSSAWPAGGLGAGGDFRYHDRKEFLDKEIWPKILCGDFNLMSDTKVSKMLESDLENLVKHGPIAQR